MKKNFDRFSIGRHDDEFRDTTVKGLGGFVGTLLGLLVVGCLLDKIQKGDGQVSIGEGEGFFRHLFDSGNSGR